MLAYTLILLHFLSFASFADTAPDRPALTLPDNCKLHCSECRPANTGYRTSGREIQNLDSLRQKIEEGICSDPDIKMAFVNTAIDSNAEEHFPFAQQVYFELLQEEITEAHMNIIEAEAKKMLPLIPERQKSDWQHKIEVRDPALATDITHFWKLRDPVRSTPVNERMSEHWQRIAHAKNNFTKNSHGVYGTDDRGTIYVKYGEPTFKRSGLLSPSNTEIRSKLYDLATFKGGIDSRELFNLNMSIRQQYMPKYYEVWVYRNLEKKQPLIYIFGESANKGTFGLRKSLKDFIPNGSFNTGISSSWRYDTGPRGLTAGPFLQMALYDRLSTIDIYFGRQLTRHEDNWMKYMRGQLNFNAFKMMSRSPEAEMELQRLQNRVAETKSTLEDRLSLISQQHKSYRFLDENNKPYRKVIVFSEPHHNLIPYDAVISQHQKPVYKLTASAELIDSKGYTTYGDKEELFLRGDRAGAIGTLLNIPESNASMDTASSVILVSSEVARIPQRKNEEDQADKFILASAVDQVSTEEPLSIESGPMEVSDIIWGYSDDEQPNYIEELSFSVPKDERLPRDKNLTVYFETYHAKTGTDSQYHYQVDYSIQQKKRRKLKDTGIKLTLNLSSASQRGSENIEIETADLEPGSYRAVFRFSTPSAPDIIKERHINFRIEE